MNYIHNSLDRLKQYCENEKFKGWDPYDGLNSIVFKILPFKYFSMTRLLWLQLFKLSPINLRNLFLVPKEHNPKGLALFLSAYANLYNISGEEKDKERIDYIIGKLYSLRSKEYGSKCWGYNFDWQSRTFFIPAFTPNVITSTFVGNAFLDMYDITGDDAHLDTAKSVSEFILDGLNRTLDGNGSFCFSYSPIDKSKIFNASLLASKFLSRVYFFTKDGLLKDMAKGSIEFCCHRQNKDGGWFYGAENNQRWIDSFHTAYNLESISAYGQYTGDKSYGDNLERGLNFYLSNFFSREGIPRYYNDSTYPIDIHSAAALVILLCKLGIIKNYVSLADGVLRWTIDNMQDEEGYFYYQIKKCYKVKMPYMRWACAWIFYALSCIIKELGICKHSRARDNKNEEEKDSRYIYR